METVLKKKRSVVKREKKEALKLAKKQGPATAHLNNVPTSERKMRLVADLIRGQKANIALGILKYQAKQGAIRLEKLLLGAIADWQAKHPETRVEEADLFVKEIFVDGGRVLKRLRVAPQGRGYRIRKRSNHVTITIDSHSAAKTAATASVATEEKEAPKKAKTTSKPKAEKSAPAAKKTTKKTDK